MEGAMPCRMQAIRASNVLLSREAWGYFHGSAPTAIRRDFRASFNEGGLRLPKLAFKSAKSLECIIKCGLAILDRPLNFFGGFGNL